jgi:hypothetical protein
MANTIVSKVQGSLNYNEYDAAAAGILPGMLVRQTDERHVNVHNVEGGTGQLMIVIEDALQGKDDDEAYTINEPVRCWIPQRGDEFYGLVQVGQLTVGGVSQMVSGGDGTFKVSTAVSSGVTAVGFMAVALADEDLTVSGAVDTLVKMRAL